MLLMVIVFSIERLLTIRKALGSGSISDFIRKVQYHLANRNVDAALSECDKQRGSVGNVMKAGLRRYKEMINETGLDTEQKVLSIQKEVEEATALELPMLREEPRIPFYYYFSRYPGGPVRNGNRDDQIICCIG